MHLHACCCSDCILWQCMRRLVQLVQHPHYSTGSELVRAKDVRERIWCWLAIGAQGLRILDETQMTVKLSAEWEQLESCVAHGCCIGLKDRSGREVTARSAPSVHADDETRRVLLRALYCCGSVLWQCTVVAVYCCSVLLQCTATVYCDSVLRQCTVAVYCGSVLL